MQSHLHPFLHLDPGHSAIAAEGPNLDSSGIDVAIDVALDVAADGVCDSIRAALPRANLSQAREGEL